MHGDSVLIRLGHAYGVGARLATQRQPGAELLRDAPAWCDIDTVAPQLEVVFQAVKEAAFGILCTLGDGKLQGFVPKARLRLQ